MIALLEAAELRVSFQFPWVPPDSQVLVDLLALGGQEKGPALCVCGPARLPRTGKSPKVLPECSRECSQKLGCSRECSRECSRGWSSCAESPGRFGPGTPEESEKTLFGLFETLGRTLSRLLGSCLGYSFQTLFGLFRRSGPEGPGRPCVGRGRLQPWTLKFLWTCLLWVVVSGAWPFSRPHDIVCPALASMSSHWDRVSIVLWSSYFLEGDATK